MKEVNCTLSIIIPVYNASKYINRCVDSLLIQPYNDFEIILVNDGSTDDSGLICDELAAKDSRVTTIHKVNGGVSSARNAGLSKCTGKYVFFVDSDDYLQSNALSVMYKDIAEEDNSLIVYNYVKVFETESIATSFKPGSMTGDDFIEGMLRYNGTGGVGGKLFHAQEAKEISFSEVLKLGEDTKYLIDYLQKSKGSVIVKEEALYNYVQLSSSASHRPDLLNELTKLNECFIKTYSSVFLTSQLRYALGNYIANNIKIKYMGGCNVTSIMERRYLLFNYKYCIKRYSFKVRVMYAILIICPSIAYAMAQRFKNT